MKNLTISLLAIFLYACTNPTESEPSEVKLAQANAVPDKSLSLKVEPGQYKAALSLNVYRRNDSLLGMINDPGWDRLVEYHLESGEIVHTIPLGFLPTDIDLAVRYLGKNDIYVSYNPSQRPNYNHDSTLFHIDYYGNILRVMSLEEAHVNISGRENYPPSKMAYMYNWINNMPTVDSLLMLSFESMQYGTGDTGYHNNFFYCGGHLDLASNTFHPHKISFPGGSHLYYPRGFESPYVDIGHRENPLYAFGHSANLYEYDIEKQVLIEHHIKSRMIDTVLPLPEPVEEIHYNRPQRNPQQPAFQHFFYDTNNHRYYRFFTLAVAANATSHDARNAPRGFMILDTNFNCIAEGLLPSNVYLQKELCFKDGFYSFNNDALQSDPDHLRLDFYTIEISDRVLSLDSLLQNNSSSPVKRMKLEEYVKSKFNFGPDKTHVVFFVPVQQSCKGCKDYLLEYFSKNYTNTDRNYRLSLFLASKDFTGAASEVDKYKLPPYSPQIVVDTEGEYEKYIDPQFSQGRIFVFKDNKLSMEVIMDPKGLGAIETILGTL